MRCELRRLSRPGHSGVVVAKRLLSFTVIWFLSPSLPSPAIAHPGAAIVVDAKGQVYFVDTGHGVWTVDAELGSSSISVARRFTG